MPEILGQAFQPTLPHPSVFLHLWGRPNWESWRIVIIPNTNTDVPVETEIGTGAAAEIGEDAEGGNGCLDIHMM
jgi:hypothetical protein